MPQNLREYSASGLLAESIPFPLRCRGREFQPVLLSRKNALLDCGRRSQPAAGAVRPVRTAVVCSAEREWKAH